MCQCTEEPWGLIIDQGASWTRTFQLRTAIPPAGAPVPIYGATARLIAKDSDGGDITLADLTGTIDAANGLITVSMTPAETLAIPTVGLQIATVTEITGYKVCNGVNVPCERTITGPFGEYDLEVTYSDQTVAFPVGGPIGIKLRV